MHPLQQNDTGSFQELAHASDVAFGQLSLLTIAPRCKRGGHYHTHKEEWFCCLHGRCYLILIGVYSKRQRSLALDDAHKEFVGINSYEAHIVLNPYDQECELLVISSGEYDPENPDTVTYREYPEECEVHGVQNCPSCKEPK